MIILFILVISKFSWAQEESINQTTKSMFQLSGQVIADTKGLWDCMDPVVLGACLKPMSKIPIGVKVRYWEPEVFMETVKMPGDHVIIEWGTLLKGLYKEMATSDMKSFTGINPLTVTSGSSSGSLNSTHLQFNETHIYDFPVGAILAFFGTTNMPNVATGIRFASEMKLNTAIWRTGRITKDSPDLLTVERELAGKTAAYCYALPLGQGGCMKAWGSLYPRQGFVVTPSPVIASVVDSLRAVSITGGVSTYVKIPLDFDLALSIDKIQLVFPNQTACHPIGYDPRTLEQEVLQNQSGENRYVWVYWHRRVRCFGEPV
ncbi:MAG: TraU family protein [Candidatus Omnitrophica bacterium]|nr:TraU family protein [Candidatus Omnitrophota bacterium]